MLKSVLLAAALVSTLSLTACGKKEDPAVLAANAAAGKTFLDAKAKEPGVQKLPKGLMYKVLTPASDPNAPKPSVRDTVKVHYEGKTLDGNVFDSSFERGAPAAFALDGLVEAWKIAIPEMKKGETWELYVPAELGYGEAGMGPIPPNAVLVFKIQLIDIAP
ncbi:FKBP-type peptidyl-prolyl cis-trans isomerase [Asticcacaulis sp. BYS171W]|uniref:Peptidyl-prolyl cis-trans isomerase n=1 Tax=Asticcacaulis aquaticus TaxID=2984212 RepID=A0ABT5HSY9_9CAUL|nr:FKBP-type peptidyl-prolyl cis-trans isomerase [Asticcacaulis aquaticus]MDC7683109.1 FKBP-type peptidyl-prolyl cis-trans isomerase [Asticcacaulis aquaticus]